MPDITVNVVTSEVTVNTPAVRCNVSAAPIEVEINCCGGGVLGVPQGGDVGDVLTKTGGDATDYEWLAPGASANLETWPAGENLSSGKIVIISSGEAIYFQPANATHAGRAYGVTKTSASAGNDVTIQVSGNISDPSFVFTAESGLYAAANGAITETKPTTQLIQFVGIAVGAGLMKIQFWPTIQ